MALAQEEDARVARGVKAGARDLAVALIAAYEGITVLASALRDPELISAEGGRLERWIDGLAEPAASSGPAG